MNVDLQLQCTREGSRVEAGGEGGKKGAGKKTMGRLIYKVILPD